MNITCISAANIEGSRQNSASLRACALVDELLTAELPGAEVAIVPLLDYEMKPCRMCGRCCATQRCARDQAFNQVFEKMIAADGLFLVVPHYAPLPSKLMILTEKMEEMAFLGWCADPAYRFPLHGRPVGVIGHGGQETSEEVVAYYQKALVEPVAAALRSVSLAVIAAAEDAPDGAAFGIRSITRRPDSIFVDIQHDWEDVRRRVAPLVQRVAAAVSARQN
jgi:hypothetical protein